MSNRRKRLEEAAKHNRQANGNKRKAKKGAVIQSFREAWPLLIILVFCIGMNLYVYNRYGKRMFFPRDYFDMDWTPEQWRTHLDSDERKVLLIGGPHRSGTTILWDAITKHPELSGFGSTFDTGVDYSEGILFQDVYPRFGIGLESQIWKQKSNEMKGVGKYALAEEGSVHWTPENHGEDVTPENFANLMNRFGPYWDNLNATVLVEKSPPNAVMSLFLESLYNVPISSSEEMKHQTIANDDEFGDLKTNRSRAKGSSRSVTKHLFITRHPIANVHAHDAFLHGIVEFKFLFENYVKLHEYMFEDIKRLENEAKVVKLEDFAANPLKTLKSIYKWLEVDDSDAIVEEIINKLLDKKIGSRPNDKYLSIWCDRTDEEFDDLKLQLELLQKRIDNLKYLDYDMVSWCDDYNIAKSKKIEKSEIEGDEL